MMICRDSGMIKTKILMELGIFYTKFVYANCSASIMKLYFEQIIPGISYINNMITTIEVYVHNIK